VSTNATLTGTRQGCGISELGVVPVKLQATTVALRQTRLPVLRQTLLTLAWGRIGDGEGRWIHNHGRTCSTSYDRWRRPSLPVIDPLRKG